MKYTKYFVLLGMIATFFFMSIKVEAVSSKELMKKYNIEVEEKNIIDVSDFGAVGNGKDDDTKNIQKALDEAGDSKGKVVYFPKGTYMINTNDSESTKENVQRFVNTSVGLKVKSNTTILMDDDAVLKAIPNEFYSYTVLNFKESSNVSIYGGQILGDREDHIYKYAKLRRGNPEYNGETGWGILMVSSSNIIIDNVTISGMWGDGIDLFADKESKTSNSHIKIKNSHISNNRRQGISIENAENLLIENNVIEKTKGTDPSAGINIEPADFKNHSLRAVKDVIIRKNKFLNNDDAGVLLYGMGEKVFYDKDGDGNQQKAQIDNILISENDFDGNNTNHQNVQDGAWAGAYNGQIMIVGASNVDVHNNKLTNPKPLGSMNNTNAQFKANSNPYAGILVGYSDSVNIWDNQMKNQNISVINQWSPEGTFAYPNSTNIVIGNNDLKEVVLAEEGKNKPDVTQDKNFKKSVEGEVDSTVSKIDKELKQDNLFERIIAKIKSWF